MVLHFLQSSLKVSSLTLLPNTRILNPTTTWILIPRNTQNNLKGCVHKQRSTWTRKNTRFGPSTIHSGLLQRKISIKKSTKPQQKAPSEPEHQQDSTDPVFYREVDMSNLPSQYAEEVETFRQILELPDSRETLPTCRKVQNGNTRVHQGLSDSRGMGVIDRPIRCLPSHPHPPKLKEVPKVCHKSQVFQFTSLPFGLSTAPQVFTMIVKEVKLMALTRGIRLHWYLDDWLIRAQSQEEAQVNTQTVVDLTQSLGWIINLLKCFCSWAMNTIQIQPL